MAAGGSQSPSFAPVRVPHSPPNPSGHPRQPTNTCTHPPTPATAGWRPLPSRADPRADPLPCPCNPPAHPPTQVAAFAAKNKRFAAIDRAISRDGLKFVTLLRLSPLLPLAASNYLYGLTSVDLGSYVLGSWLGMLPGTYAYVTAGGSGVEAWGLEFGGLHSSWTEMWVLGMPLSTCTEVLALA